MRTSMIFPGGWCAYMWAPNHGNEDVEPAQGASLRLADSQEDQMDRRTLLTGSLGSLAGASPVAGALAKESAGGPPEPQREFRAVWVATLANIDWPSNLG